MNETTKTSKIYKALVIVFSIALVGVTGFFFISVLFSASFASSTCDPDQLCDRFVCTDLSDLLESFSAFAFFKDLIECFEYWLSHHFFSW